jgi:hypothetical protein
MKHVNDSLAGRAYYLRPVDCSLDGQDEWRVALNLFDDHLRCAPQKCISVRLGPEQRRGVVQREVRTSCELRMVPRERALARLPRAGNDNDAHRAEGDLEQWRHSPGQQPVMKIIFWGHGDNLHESYRLFEQVGWPANEAPHPAQRDGVSGSAIQECWAHARRCLL